MFDCQRSIDGIRVLPALMRLSMHEIERQLFMK